MASPCDNVELFVDGELPPDEAESFRQHLPDCPRCQREISALLQLKYLGKEASELLPASVEAPSSPMPPPGWRRPGLLVAASFAAGLLVAVAMVRFLPQVPSTETRLAFAQGARRQEARFPYGDADRHRPRARETRVMSGGAGATSEELPHDLLNELRGRNEIQELVAALLSYNEQPLAREALQLLERLELSPEREATRAVALLVLKRNDEALQAADAALALKPRMPQALWNRALALRELHLPRMAARDFKEVAALKEPGWAEEATHNAVDLERSSTESFERWRAMNEAGRALLDGPPVSLPQGFSSMPSARLYFYDAVRAAPDRERVLALLRLAEELDARTGGQVLQDLVRRVSAMDFARRAPLAHDYKELTRALWARDNQTPLTEAQKVVLTKSWQDAFLGRLRASGEADLLLGTLVLLGVVQQELAPLQAAATVDPWFDIMLAQHRAAQHGAPAPAIRTLLDAYQRHCSTPGLEYRCIQLDIALSGVYLQSHQLAEARRHAERGRQQARAGSEWYLEQDLLWQLAQTSRMASDVPHLARACYGEYLERRPEDPDMRRAVYQHLADISWNELRVDDARRDIDMALATGRSLSASGAFTLSDLARLRREPEDEAWLSRVRESASRMEDQWLSAHALARFVIERDMALGRTWLRDLIQQVTGPAETGNPTARRVRAYSFTSLIFESGKRSAFDEALALFAQERGVELPTRCLLAATVDSERTLLLVRGAQGELVGDYDDSRRERLGPRLDGLVAKESLLAPLRACQQVEVLARPPLHGRTGLLPPEFAWSYLTRRSATRVPPAPDGKRHLVVFDVEVADSALPRLNPWTPGFGPEEEQVRLTGARATPSNVLAAMKDATEIDLVTHGNIHSSVSTSYLLLAPDAKGSELALADVRATPLQGAPFVVLAACKAAHTTYAVHEPLSLPMAFFDAGARGVLAATQDIYDLDANEFFNNVRARMRSGTPPAIALRDERQAWLGAGRGTTWLGSVLLFE